MEEVKAEVERHFICNVHVAVYFPNMYINIYCLPITLVIKIMKTENREIEEKRRLCCIIHGTNISCCTYELAAFAGAC